MSTTITTPEGSTVTAEEPMLGMRILVLAADGEPPVEAGALMNGAYLLPHNQPLISLRPSTLRAIADLIEEN